MMQTYAEYWLEYKMDLCKNYYYYIQKSVRWVPKQGETE